MKGPLSRLAAAYESREGRDLRGLLDFLAARAETDTEAQAATAAEGHDGVRKRRRISLAITGSIWPPIWTSTELERSRRPT